MTKRKIIYNLSIPKKNKLNIYIIKNIFINSLFKWAIKNLSSFLIKIFIIYIINTK